MSALHHHGLYIYDWQVTTGKYASEVPAYALQSSTEVKTFTLQDLQELTSLFVHFSKGIVMQECMLFDWQTDGAVWQWTGKQNGSQDLWQTALL